MPLEKVTWRSVFALALAGCVVPAAPVLSPEDTDPPRVRSTTPPEPDGGALPSGSPIQIVFSEPMDPNTLRPGIAVLTGNPAEELPLTIAVPEASPVPDYAQSPAPYTVQVTPGGGTRCSAAIDAGFCFVSGAYLLQLRTLLTDPSGNPLAEEIDVHFTAR